MPKQEVVPVSLDSLNNADGLSPIRVDEDERCFLSFGERGSEGEVVVVSRRLDRSSVRLDFGDDGGEGLEREGEGRRRGRRRSDQIVFVSTSRAKGVEATHVNEVREVIGSGSPSNSESSVVASSVLVEVESVGIREGIVPDDGQRLGLLKRKSVVDVLQEHGSCVKKRVED